MFYFETSATIDSSTLDSLKLQFEKAKALTNSLPEEKYLFLFNPNTIDSVSLEKLDVPEKIKRNLIRYRNNGGRFYSEEDFRKLYGMNDSLMALLLPFIELTKPDRIEMNKQDTAESFEFDPNTATNADYSRLGLSEKQISVIRNFQKKGGEFRSKEDFRKIRGLTEIQKTRLEALIVINQAEKSKLETTEYTNQLVELNTADSIQLKELPGIGDKLSKRIVKYRDLLGGFYTIEQLKEVYGMNEITVTRISDRVLVDAGKLKKINLNFADYNDLARHPYLSKNLARSIVQFRTKYGNIADPRVLSDSMILNMSEYSRLKPYFSEQK